MSAKKYYASWTELGPYPRDNSRAFATSAERSAYREWWAMYPGRTTDWRYWEDFCASSAPTPAPQARKSLYARWVEAELAGDPTGIPPHVYDWLIRLRVRQTFAAHTGFAGECRAYGEDARSLRQCIAEVEDTHLALRSQYVALSCPATHRFACSEAEQIAWAEFLRPVRAVDIHGVEQRFTTEVEAALCGFDKTTTVLRSPPANALPAVSADYHGESWQGRRVPLTPPSRASWGG